MRGLRGRVGVNVAIVAGLVACGAAALMVGRGAALAEGGGKKIVAGKPTYKSKGDHPSWKEKGRIVGLVRQCPGATIEALDADGKEVVQKCTVAAKGTVYELQWLAPGTYVLRVSADGYETLLVPGLVVKVNNDLHLNIEFEES